jgi:hypothetical protein
LLLLWRRQPAWQRLHWRAARGAPKLQRRAAVLLLLLLLLLLLEAASACCAWRQQRRRRLGHVRPHQQHAVQAGPHALLAGQRRADGQLVVKEACVVCACVCVCDTGWQRAQHVAGRAVVPM